jgi:uncharacterized membrane protein YbaN (DUF454 family)
MQHDASAPSVGLSAPARWLLMGLAGLCLLLGIVGIFLPVMPTVPFLIVAAWAASRSSPRLHRWLMTHPRFGRQLRDWYEHGVVPRRAKWITSVMMAGSSISMLVIAPELWTPAVLCLIAVMALVLAWLWRRPEHRPPEIAAE